MRKSYLDNVRWITVVLVVLYHVIYMYNGVVSVGVIGPFSDFQPQDILQYFVYPWFMLLLFIVSGMAARFELEKKTEREFIRKRTRKLLIPSTVGLVVFGWILGYYNTLIGGAFETMGAVPKPILFLIMCVSGTGPLWYIQMLWLFGIVLVWIRKFEKDRLYRKCAKAGGVCIFLLTLAVYGTAQIGNIPVIVVYRFGIYGFGFLTGYFLFSHDEVMERLEKCWILFMFLAIVSGVVFIGMNYGKPYPEHEVLDTLPCNVFAWLGCVGILAFMKKWGDFENVCTRWMNERAWGLYLFHYLPLAVTAWYLKKLVPGMVSVAVYLLTGAAGFAGAFLLEAVICRIPILRFCVMGIKKEKKK